MDPFSFLETTAEISITFAGFISIFLVLARRDGSFHPAVALPIRLILITSVASLFFAALPLVLAGLGVSGAALWRFPSVVFVLVGTGATFFVVSNRRRLPSTQQTATFAWVGHSLNALSLVASVANMLGWPLPPNAGVYLASVWLLLGVSCVNFLGLVFGRVLGTDTG